EGGKGGGRMTRKQYERQVYLPRERRYVATIYDTTAPENVSDPTGGRWVVVCEAHGTLVNTTTLRDAAVLAETREFCEEEPTPGPGTLGVTSPTGSARTR